MRRENQLRANGKVQALQFETLGTPMTLDFRSVPDLLGTARERDGTREQRDSRGKHWTAPVHFDGERYFATRSTKRGSLRKPSKSLS